MLDVDNRFLNLFMNLICILYSKLFIKKKLNKYCKGNYNFRVAQIFMSTLKQIRLQYLHILF